MKFDMNIKTKLTVSIGVLVAMIVLLVSLSVTNLQILTATAVSYTHLTLPTKLEV